MLDTVHTFTRANSIVGANIQAFSALLAKGMNETYLCFFRETFGISAPLAGQWATFKENHGPDAWSVVNGKPLNIGDDGAIHMKSDSICSDKIRVPIFC